MIIKRKTGLMASLILGCVSLSMTMPMPQVLAKETTDTNNKPTENSTLTSGPQEGLTNLLPINSPKSLIPNQVFMGNIGDHPILESFGDVEGQGVLTSTERDTGRARVIPFTSKTTPNRQMAMKLGNFKFNTNYTYPTDDKLVATLVNEQQLNTNAAVPDGSGVWNSIFLDTASVGFISEDGKSFYDVGTSPVTGRSARSVDVILNDSLATKGFFIGQSKEGAATITSHNNEMWHWSFQDTSGGGVSIGYGGSLKNEVVLMKMYNNPDAPYSVAYGAHVIKASTAQTPLHLMGYVRVIMQPVNEEGRVRITYSYVSLNTRPDRTHSALNVSYNSALTDTKSLGNDTGEYFKTASASDKKGYAYATYRDEYPIISPSATINSPIGRVVDYFGRISAFELGISPVEPGVGQSFERKGLGYIGKKQATPVGEPASWDIDVQGFNVNTLTVKHLLKGTNTALAPQEVRDGLFGKEYKTEPKEIAKYRVVEPLPDNASGVFAGNDITVTYYYELRPTDGNVISHFVTQKGDTISKDVVLKGKIDTQYTVKPINIAGYVYLDTQGEASGVIKEKDQEVSFVYIPQNDAFKLKQEVTNSADLSVDNGTAKQGETLTYRLKLEPIKEVQDLSYLYQSIDVTEVMDPFLEDIKAVELKDSTGAVVGTATYNKATHKITGKLTNLTLVTTQGIELSYQATIKKDATIGQTIREKGVMDVAIKLGDLSAKATGLTSNEVATEIESGMLELISVPEEINFGAMKLADFQKKVGVDSTNISEPLIIADKRITRAKWDIVAEVEKEMTNSGDVLTGSIRYVYHNVEKILNNSPQLIYENDGSSQDALFNITDTWGKAEVADGLKFKIDSSKAPKTTGSYEGIIKWTLRDTID